MPKPSPIAVAADFDRSRPNDIIVCLPNSALYNAESIDRYRGMKPGSLASASLPNALHTVWATGSAAPLGAYVEPVEHPEHDDEDGHLRHDRQTRGHGIDLVLLSRASSSLR